ncbi:MAG: enterochelin esterase [Alphaproteobacteria bacterium]|nr:enterochelin esterase [Alphaproteobacteria bacterium]
MRLGFLLAAAIAAIPAAALTAPVEIPVSLGPAIRGAVSGRLIVFAAPVQPGTKADEPLDASPFNPTGTAVAAREVGALAPGETAIVDAETDTFPAPFSALPPGRYRFQAVLDRNHDYNYGGRGEGDIVSRVAEATLPGPPPALVLTDILPADDPDATVAAAPEAERAELRRSLGAAVPIDFVSPKLSAFWGRPIHMRGWIGLPPAYAPAGRASWPTLYMTQGFGSTLASARSAAARAIRRMAKSELPPMIWVVLDESSPTGTHEFADSVNNGPWGEALTAELIPWLEKHYRMDARANGRFLNGHSSGGWATLWLQVRYPDLFGGTWSTSPDPSDFHDFTGIDIYRPNANAYVDAAGAAIPLVRYQGREVASIRDFGRLEGVIGAYGGQFASFDWVFSPKGPDGRPLPLFDRSTGAVDPAVAAYWRDHFDIAWRLQRDWPALKPRLDGKIHVIVGTADTFHLDGSAHRLQAVLQRLGAHASITFLPGRSHFDLYEQPGDKQGLMRQIAWEMYAIARPGAKGAPPPAK